MKVKELIKHLNHCNPEAEVCIAQPAHDYLKNVLIVKIKNVRGEYVTYSDYHRSNVIAGLHEPADNTVLVLS